MFVPIIGKLAAAVLAICFVVALDSFLAALVLGAIGLAVGHLIDLRVAADRTPIEELPEPRRRDELEVESRRAFAGHLSNLFVAVARVDGEVVQDEVRVMREFFQNSLRFPPVEMEVVRQLLKDAIAVPPDLETAARGCRELKSSEMLLLLDALFALGFADGPLRHEERDAIRRAARAMDVPEQDFRAIAALHFGEGQEHYEQLGIGADATDDEVRSAFRRLAAVHHPDKVAHLGAGAMAVAQKRFLDIQAAYDAIRRLRGLR